MFTPEELTQIKGAYNANQASASNKKRPAPQKKKEGRGGFLSSIISELGGGGGALGGAAAGATIGSVVPGVGTAIGGLVGAGLGGFLGGTGGRIIENKVRDNRVGLGDALKEGAISGVAGAGPLRLLKGAAGATKGVAAGTGALAGADSAIGTSLLGKLTGSPGAKLGERLTEAGSGLKADKNVGGIQNLKQNSQFMAKYTGSPRQQRVKMEADMKNLSGKVDSILDTTPAKVNGTAVGQRLKTAMEDLTDERFVDLDLNNPSVSKIIGRYSEKFAKAPGAKGVNDITKTLNKTASRAQSKLVNPTAGALTAQEQAALALKRAADDVLGEVPEIAPFKKQMAQIFETTPQVATRAEKGLSVSPFIVGGLNSKAPIQGLSSAESRLGARLQGVAPEPSKAGILGKVLGANALDTQLPEEQTVEEPTGLDTPETTDLEALGTALEEPTSDNPFAPENAEASVQKIIASGGDMKDIAAYLSNVKALQELGGTGTPVKKTESQRARDEASQLTDTALQQLEGGSVRTGLVGTKIEGIKRLLGNADPETLNFNVTVDSLKAAIAKARAGTSFTPNEEKLLNKYAPTSGDTGQVLKSKLSALQQVYQAAQAREAQTQYQPDSLVGVGL